jgi:hypothetical protein
VALSPHTTTHDRYLLSCNAASTVLLIEQHECHATATLLQPASCGMSAALLSPGQLVTNVGSGSAFPLWLTWMNPALQLPVSTLLQAANSSSSSTAKRITPMHQNPGHSSTIIESLSWGCVHGWQAACLQRRSMFWQLLLRCCDAHLCLLGASMRGVSNRLTPRLTPCRKMT